MLTREDHQRIFDLWTCAECDRDFAPCFLKCPYCSNYAKPAVRLPRSRGVAPTVQVIKRTRPAPTVQVMRRTRPQPAVKIIRRTR